MVAVDLDEDKLGTIEQTIQRRSKSETEQGLRGKVDRCDLTEV